MITLNAIVQRAHVVACQQDDAQRTRQQQRVLSALAACRTEALGGQVFTCPDCQTTRYSYHSCRNRHCPSCQQDAGAVWLAEQQTLLLPVPYFLVTFTLPAELRALAQAHQAAVYSAMFRASAAGLQDLAADPRFLGGQLGMLGILQTWTRDLRYHPHIHYLVPAVGLAPTGQLVFPPTDDFLVHVRPLAALFRAKLQASLRQMPFADTIPAATWQRDWVVDCRPVGTGEAALKYLAPYIFRVALSNNRILRADDDQVTFRYTHSASGEQRTATLSVAAFMERFIAHILPKGFVKVRYYGLFRPASRAQLRRVRTQLMLQRGLDMLGGTPAPAAPVVRADRLATCPTCGTRMQGRPLKPVARAPPRAPPRRPGAS